MLSINTGRDTFKRTMMVAVSLLLLVVAFLVTGIVYVTVLQPNFATGMRGQGAAAAKAAAKAAAANMPPSSSKLQMHFSADRLFILWANGDFVGVGGYAATNSPRSPNTEVRAAPRVAAPRREGGGRKD